jgi:transcriptional regulator with XRE-family HTH domain
MVKLFSGNKRKDGEGFCGARSLLTVTGDRMSARGHRTVGSPAEPGADQDAPRFGRRIKELRQQKSWTLEQLGRESGVSISALSKIENEQVTPAFDTLVKISRAFGYSFDEFFRASGNSDFAFGLRTTTNDGQGIHFSSRYYDYEVHSAELTHKGMIPLVMRIRTRDLPPRQDWSSHEGEEIPLRHSGRRRTTYAVLRAGAARQGGQRVHRQQDGPRIHLCR